MIRPIEVPKRMPAKHRLRSTVIALLAGLLIGVGGGSAYAVTSSSGWYSPSTSGVQINAWIESSPKSGGGWGRRINTTMQVSDVAIGPRVYVGSALCASSPRVFNSAGVSQFSNSVSATGCGSGTARSNPDWRVWTGTSYWSGRYASPNQSW